MSTDLHAWISVALQGHLLRSCGQRHNFGLLWRRHKRRTHLFAVTVAVPRQEWEHLCGQFYGIIFVGCLFFICFLGGRCGVCGDCCSSLPLFRTWLPRGELLMWGKAVFPKGLDTLPISLKLGMGRFTVEQGLKPAGPQCWVRYCDHSTTVPRSVWLDNLFSCL